MIVRNLTVKRSASAEGIERADKNWKEWAEIGAGGMTTRQIERVDAFTALLEGYRAERREISSIEQESAKKRAEMLSFLQTPENLALIVKRGARLDIDIYRNTTITYDGFVISVYKVFNFEDANIPELLVKAQQAGLDPSQFTGFDKGALSRYLEKSASEQAATLRSMILTDKLGLEVQRLRVNDTRNGAELRK